MQGEGGKARPPFRPPARPEKRNLPGKGHERWVQREREEEVAGGHGGHGQDGDEVGDAPVVRDEGCDGQDDDADDEEQRKGHGELELLANSSVSKYSCYGSEGSN